MLLFRLVLVSFIWKGRIDCLNGRGVLSDCLTALWQNGGKMIA